MMADKLKDDPKDKEIERLHARVAELEAELGKLRDDMKRANLSQPMKTVRELDQARAQRDKVYEERDEGRTKLGELSDGVTTFAEDIREADMAFATAGPTNSKEGNESYLYAVKLAVLGASSEQVTATVDVAISAMDSV